MNVKTKTHTNVGAAKKAKSVKSDITKTMCDIMKQLPKTIQTKIKNINKARVEGPCSTKRVSQSSRVSIPYDMVKGFTVNQISTYEAGVVIRLPYDIYEDIRDKPERNELEEYLLHNIGSNNNVSAFICIMNEDGYSGSTDLRLQFEKFEKEQKIKDWTPIKRINGGKNINKGNDKWEGHYYYKISGGQQTSILSHPQDKKDQMFTTYKGFMSNSKVITDVKACLIYSLLHCHDMCKLISNELLVKYKQSLEDYLRNTNYMGKSCYELTRALGTIKNGELYSPIGCERLSVNMFETENMINISHNEAVCKNKIYFCEDNHIMLSDYRPGNLFWDTNLSNMQQQDFTIEEYWADHDRKSALRAQLVMLD